MDDIEQTHRDNLADAIRGSHKPSGTRMDRLRWIVEHHQAARVEGLYVDGLTAQGLVQLHDRLNDANRATLLALPLRKAVSVMWKIANR